jgi:hypothetical protein
MREIRMATGKVLLALLACGTMCGQAIRVGKPKAAFSGSGTLSLAVSPNSASIPLTRLGEGVTLFLMTTAWSGSTTGAIQVNAYFGSTTGLVTADGLANIPTSAIYAYARGGGVSDGFQPFTANTPVPGASVGLVSMPSQALTNGNRTDPIFILIELGNRPQQAASTYTGTIYFLAEEY